MENKIKKVVLKILAENRKLLEEEKLTKKQVRRMAEERLEMQPKSLDSHKATVSEAVNEFLEANAEEESSPEPAVESPRKKAKVEKSPASGDKEKKRSVKIKFYDNVDLPKFVKKSQANLMSGSAFEAKAEDIELNVHDNIVTLCARTFTSGNRGWYGGGKLPLLVGKKRVWAQLGCNVTILGSKEWDA